MTSLKELYCCLVLLCVSVLPVLPQNCDQFTIQPPVGPGMPLVIRDGGSATLTCSHATRAPFTVSWFRETTVIRPDNADTLGECSCEVPGVDPTDTTVTSRELNFVNFAGMFSGEYSCRAPDNITLQTSSICRFQVLVAERPSIQDPVPQQNHTVAIDGTLSIPVTVAGVPSPEISWRNSTTELTDSGRVTIGSSGGLTVTDVQTYDRGNYSLRLSNLDGNVTEYFSVFVPFVEIISISDPQVSGSEISAVCEVVGYPNPSIQWEDSSRNEITSNIRTNIVSNTYETTISATITVDRFNCQGPYSCSARNTNAQSRITTQLSTDLCSVPEPPPQPTSVMVIQNGQGSVRVSWEIVSSNVDFTFEVCYTRVDSGGTVCPGTGLSKTTTQYDITSGLEVEVNYAFQVVSVNNLDRIESVGKSLELSPCLGEVSVQVSGVSVNTAVNEGERTFNISWREVQNDNDVFGYKVEEKRGWFSVVNRRIVTNLITPANFCNGENHEFVVMAINNCGLQGPPSASVVGKCESPGRVKITSVTPSGTAINVTWALKASASSYSIQPPLSITVLEIQIDSNGQQLQYNYSTNSVNSECLGGLKPSTTYKICLHPVYSDGLTEIMPVCMDTVTKSSDGDGFDTGRCMKPTNMTKQGNTFEQALLPDYAIAVIVIGALILLAVVFCGIGVCFACSNSKSKDIDDIGSEYSSSIAAGMGVQGRMSSNHNRNMSPTRSCLSYHSKGHSTNWQDHMGTLREMETEVGTNV